ncbi:MAG: hypothetical protein H6819_09045 [Phycisphaerales bacterium]|nr:hypothetical protein [Phycisphaerales bacterium]MCB9856026.1 hypothetical protein [Phycisphaerales bacterium]
MNNTQSDRKLSKSIKTIRALAPEDIRIGDYVAITQLVLELPSFFWNDATSRDPSTPVRLPWTPGDGGLPRRVVDVCLPFVFVQEPDGRHSTLDTRRHRLARLNKRYARAALKRMAQDRKRRPKAGEESSVC